MFMIFGRKALRRFISQSVRIYIASGLNHRPKPSVISEVALNLSTFHPRIVERPKIGLRYYTIYAQSSPASPKCPSDQPALFDAGA
jgi:hypothetical protein